MSEFTPNNNNRRLLSIRLNKDQQKSLQTMMQFYEVVDPMRLLYFALEQLQDATATLAKRMHQKELAEQSNAAANHPVPEAATGSNGSIKAEA